MEFSDLKVSGGEGGGGGGVRRVMHYLENLSIKYHDENFYIKTACSGQH